MEKKNDNLKKIREEIVFWLPDFIINWINKRRISYHFYQNINYDLHPYDQKRVLISYITYPLENDISRFTTHSNFAECLEIMKSFIDLGWSVDVVHCLDTKHNQAIDKKKYDLIFGFGEPFIHASLKNPNAIKIVYLTESHPDFSLSTELERCEYNFQRHKNRTIPNRTGKYIRTQDIDIADYKILLGNSFTSTTYSSSQSELYTLAPTGLINLDYIFKERDTRKTRENFIWFGSYGAIHKGLDILIDVFNVLKDYNLYICGLDRTEKRLFRINEKNVRDMGFIDVTSKSFIDLMNSCSYVILPSCSEGMATSVLTCMNHGLIPIVTRECGIDLQEWGVYLEDYHVEYIEEKVKACATCNPQIVENYHKLIFDYSRKKFIIGRFSQDFRKIILDILSRENN